MKNINQKIISQSQSPTQEFQFSTNQRKTQLDNPLAQKQYQHIERFRNNQAHQGLNTSHVIKQNTKISKRKTIRSYDTSPDGILSDEIKKAIRSKIISMMMNDVDNDGGRIKKKTQPIVDNINKHLEKDYELKAHSSKTKTEDENVKEIIEKYNKELIEQKILKSKRLQNVIIEASILAEQVIRDEINDDGYQRFKKFDFKLFQSKLNRSQLVRKQSPKHRRSSQDLNQSQLSAYDLFGGHLKKGGDKESIYDSFHKQSVSQGKQRLNESGQVESSQHKTFFAKDNFLKINQIIDDLDDQQQSQIVDDDMDKFHQCQEEAKNVIKNHGRKLKNMLEKWCEADEYRAAQDDPLLSKYKNDTWGELINFEKKLKEEMMKISQFAERLKYSTRKNIDWVKEKTSDYMESLEIAMNEYKLQTSQQIERLQMQLEEYESKQFNVLNENDFLKSALEVEKEISDQKEISNFRQAMLQIGKFKMVLEKLHNDYVKMVGQSKSLQEDMDKLQKQNERLEDQLAQQAGMALNMMDANLAIAKVAIFYKDDDLVKTCRKTVSLFEGNPKKETYPDIASQYISFIRQYPPVDIVTPLRKENEQLKHLLYILIDYLNGTGQIIKYWVPQFEDTDEKHQTQIEGWHKNFLVTVFEHEVLQFLIRFRPNNLTLPFKFQTPTHVLDRMRNGGKVLLEKYLQDQKQKDDLAQKSQEISQEVPGSFIANDHSTDIFNKTEVQPIPNIEIAPEKNTSAQNNKVLKILSSQLTSGIFNRKNSDNMSSSRANNSSNAKKQQSSFNNKKEQSSAQKKKPQPLNVNTSQIKKEPTIIENKSGRKPNNQVAHSPTIKAFDYNQIMRDNRKANIQSLVKQVKLLPNALEEINEIMMNKQDAQIIEQVGSQIKSSREKPPEPKSNTKAILVQQPVHSLIQVQDPLTDQEFRLLQNMLVSQIPGDKLSLASNTILDAVNVLKVINEYMHHYFKQSQKERQTTMQGSEGDGENEEVLTLEMLDIFEFKNRVLLLNIEQALQYLKTNPQRLNLIFRMLVKANSFISKGQVLTNSLDQFFDKEKQRLLNEFNIPSFTQRKIMQKLLKAKDMLQKGLDRENESKTEQQQRDLAMLKMSEVFDIIQESFYKEGVNELNLLKVLTHYSKNLVNIEGQDRIDLASDLIKYKMSHPNETYDDFLQKQPQKNISNMSMTFAQKIDGDSSSQIHLVQRVSEAIQVNLPYSQFSPQPISDKGLSPNIAKNTHSTPSQQEDFLVALKTIKEQLKSQLGLNVEQDTESQMLKSSFDNRSNQEGLKSRGQQSHSSGQSNQNVLGGLEGRTVSKALVLNTDQVLVQEQKYMDKVRRETIKTIQTLQNFVKQSHYRNAGTRKSILQDRKVSQIGSVKSVSEDRGKESNSPKKKPKANFSSKRLNNSNSSQQTVTIEESVENSSSESEIRIGLSTKSRIDKKSMSKKTPISSQVYEQDSSPSIRGINQGARIVMSSQSPSKQHRGILSTPTTKANKERKNVRYSPEARSNQEDEQIDQFPDVMNQNQIKDYQSQTELDLFGLPNNFYEMDSTVYMKKMRQFDEQLEKLKRTQKAKNNDYSFNMTRQKGDLFQDKEQSQDRITQGLEDLNKRIKKIEKRQNKYESSSGLKMNFINSQVNIDNSFVPDLFMKNIEKYGVQSQQQVHRNWIVPPLVSQNSRQIEQNIHQSRRDIIGTSHQKEKRLKKLMQNSMKYQSKYYSQVNSPLNEMSSTDLNPLHESKFKPQRNFAPMSSISRDNSQFLSSQLLDQSKKASSQRRNIVKQSVHTESNPAKEFQMSNLSDLN